MDHKVSNPERLSATRKIIDQRVIHQKQRRNEQQKCYTFFLHMMKTSAATRLNVVAKLFNLHGDSRIIYFGATIFTLYHDVYLPPREKGYGVHISTFETMANKMFNDVYPEELKMYSKDINIERLLIQAKMIPDSYNEGKMQIKNVTSIHTLLDVM